MSGSSLGRQRSVLVVGSGLTAAATAGFLEQAGLDPVVASTPEGPTPAGGTVLWRPGLVLLERIGLRRPVERLGTRLADRHCLTADRSWTADRSSTPDGVDRPSLLAIDDRRLGELIEQYVLPRVRVTDRSVTAVEPTAGGVRATFEGAVTEPFDAVATTTQSLLPGPPEASTAVHSWRFGWPATLPTPPGPAEAWTDRRAALFVPVAEGFYVRLVSTAAVDSTAALSLDELEGRFGRLVEPVIAADQSTAADQPSGPLTTLDQRDLRYGRSRLRTPATIADGGIVRVGSAARGSAPGDPLAASLGIEDGWVLADALAYGPDDVGAALTDYERRRRRRERELATGVDEAAEGSPADRSWPLCHLAARRRLGFGHVHDGHFHPLAESIPQRL